MIKTEFLTARLTYADMLALKRIQEAYDLPSRTEAVRCAVRHMAMKRNLVEPAEESWREVANEQAA